MEDKYDNLIDNDSEPALENHKKRKSILKISFIIWLFLSPLGFLLLHFVFKMDIFLSLVIAILSPLILFIHEFLNYLGFPLRYGRSQSEIDTENNGMTDEFVENMRGIMSKDKNEFK